MRLVVSVAAGQRGNGTGWSIVSSPNATPYQNEPRRRGARGRYRAWSVGGGCAYRP